jgi:hypothetical protein
MTVLFNDNLLVLGDSILHIDIQTGEVLKNYGDNNEYDYLGVYDNNIVVSQNTRHHWRDNNKDFRVRKLPFYYLKQKTHQYLLMAQPQAHLTRNQ